MRSSVFTPLRGRETRPRQPPAAPRDTAPPCKELRPVTCSRRTSTWHKTGAWSLGTRWSCTFCLNPLYSGNQDCSVSQRTFLPSVHCEGRETGSGNPKEPQVQRSRSGGTPQFVSSLDKTNFIALRQVHCERFQRGCPKSDLV